MTENYNPVFNLDYGSFMSNDIGFSNFAPLEDAFGAVKFSIPFKTLLYQEVKTIFQERYPYHNFLY